MAGLGKHLTAVLVLCLCSMATAAPDRFEDNDTRPDATQVGVAPGAHIADVSIDVAGDIDWFGFTLLSQHDIDIAISFDHSEGNLDIELTDATGTVLQSGTTADDNELISAENLPQGDYYLRIFGAGNATNDDYDLSIEPGPGSSTRLLYVNDAETTGDIYPLAAGDDANSGLTPGAPKETLQSLLDDRALVPTDIVLIDTGEYDDGATITVDDEGASYVGSPAGSILTYGGTRIQLLDADFNLIYGLVFSGGRGTGIYAC